LPGLIVIFSLASFEVIANAEFKEVIAVTAVLLAPKVTFPYPGLSE